MKKVIIILSIMFTSMFFCGCKEKIDLNEYLDIKIEGYDTIGKAYYSIDYEEIYEDYEKVFDKKIGGKWGEDFNSLGIEFLLAEAIGGELSKTEGLSNGETVKFDWKIKAQQIEEAFKVKFVYKSVEEKVKGLEEGTLFNPFDEMKVTFGGTSPNGYIDIQENFSVSGLRASVSKGAGLRNGDVVTVVLEGNYGTTAVEVCAREGMIPTETVRDYTVSGLPAYVESISEITDEAIKEMDKQSKDVFEAYISENWVEKESLLEMELLGKYFLTLKPGFDSYGAQNQVVMVYKNRVKNTEGEFSYYYYTLFSNLMLNEDKTVKVDLSDYVVPENGGWFTEGTTFTRGSYYYTGYETLDELFDKLVKKYAAEYEYETDISDEVVKACKEQFIEEKSEYLTPYIYDAKEYDEIMDGSYYYDEVVAQAKKIVAGQFENDKKYIEAYSLYKEIGLTEKCEELANIIYGNVDGMSVKDAYENLLELGDTYKQDEQFSMIENMYLKQQFIDAEIGDILYFGNYEQDNDLQNGKESIAWIVIDKTDANVMLLSKDIIECKPYSKSQIPKWDESDLRQFLNGEFIEEAFSGRERDSIAVTLVVAEKNHNPKYYEVDPGNDTEDKVFILSYNEYARYGSIGGVKKYIVSEYVKEGINRIWYETWLRTPDGANKDKVCIVKQDGEAVLNEYQFATYIFNSVGVRPVININISE